MLKLSLYFFLVAIVAGALGFSGISAGASAIAQTLFFIFLVLFLGALTLGLTIFRKIS